MQLIDETTGATVAANLRDAHSYWARFRGLMLRRKLAPGEALRIDPCSSIHMFWMLFAIDAVFYDRNLRVLKVCRRVRPWVGFAAARKARGVVELAVGAASGVEPGHQLRIDD
jgi:hypothetical protein